MVCVMGDYEREEPVGGERIKETPVNTDQAAEDNRRANILCLISIACEIVPALLASVFSPILKAAMGTDNPTVTETVPGMISAFSSLSGLAAIAGLGIVIYVRIKYKDNVFGKVLMILYIIVIALGLIVLIFAVIACATACGSLCDSCRNMPGIIHTFLRVLP